MYYMEIRNLIAATQYKLRVLYVSKFVSNGKSIHYMTGCTASFVADAAVKIAVVFFLSLPFIATFTGA